jgi:hypothetical protein
MNLVLFVSIGGEFPQGAFTSLQLMNEREPLSVAGLFFSPINFQQTIAVSHTPGAGAYTQLREHQQQLLTANKAAFAELCEANGIKYSIHENVEEWNKEIFARQSRFADVVLLSGELFYAAIDDSQPNHYLHEALHVSECPVIIVPEVFARPDHLFIAYDGSKQSIYTLKQFCQVFPQYTDLPTEVIYINENADAAIPDLEELKAYCQAHFSNISFSKLQFHAGRYFASWINEKENPLLVSGSFGRSSLSYATKRAFAEQIIRQHKIPLFIAHIG